MHERRHHHTHAHLQCADGWVLCSCFVVLGHRRDTKNENEHLNNLTPRCFDIVSKAWCTPYKFFLFEVCIYIPGRERMERESNCYGPTGDAYIDRDAAAIAQQSGGIAWLQCVYVVRSTQRAYEIIIKALKSPRTSNYAKLSVFLPFVVGRLLARADSWWLYSWWWWSSLSSSSLPHNVSRLKSYMPGCCEGYYTGRTVVGPQRLEAYTHHSRFIIKRKACCVCALLCAYVNHCRTTHTHTHVHYAVLCHQGWGGDGLSDAFCVHSRLHIIYECASQRHIFLSLSLRTLFAYLCNIWNIYWWVCSSSFCWLLLERWRL